MRRPFFAIVGLFVLAAVDLTINLLAAALQQRAFADQFSATAMIWLGIAAVVGLLVGYWLGGPFRAPNAPPAQPSVAGGTEGVIMTRLRALFSYTELRGRGVSLSDILLIGSRIKIDTRG
jgi:hypothetical protein